MPLPLFTSSSSSYLDFDQSEKLTVYARYRLEKSAKEVKIERVVLDKSVRGQGQGKRLMKLNLNDITVNFPRKSIVLSAQVEVSSFYRSLGFITQGEVYDDGGSLTSSPSMSLDKKSQMHNSDPLPLDLQFSLPAVMIMILLCLGYASFYDLVMQTLELLSGSFQSRATLNFVLMAIGFLLLRLSAKFGFIHLVSLIRNHSTINSKKPSFLD